MLTTNKDFENLPTNNHPRTYYCLSTDEKPINNVINGACLIEIDTLKTYIFNREGKTWKLT